MEEGLSIKQPLVAYSMRGIAILLMLGYETFVVLSPAFIPVQIVQYNGIGFQFVDLLSSLFRFASGLAISIYFRDTRKVLALGLLILATGLVLDYPLGFSKGVLETAGLAILISAAFYRVFNEHAQIAFFAVYVAALILLPLFLPTALANQAVKMIGWVFVTICALVFSVSFHHDKKIPIELFAFNAMILVLSLVAMAFISPIAFTPFFISCVIFMNIIVFYILRALITNMGSKPQIISIIGLNMFSIYVFHFFDYYYVWQQLHSFSQYFPWILLAGAAYMCATIFIGLKLGPYFGSVIGKLTGHDVAKN